MKKTNKRLWVIEDHLCRACGGRILRCVSGNGMTPGGSPVFKCADCGVSKADTGPEELCWCGMRHRNNNIRAYACVPFSILETAPEFRASFLSCGSDPERGEVGIMSKKDFMAYRKKVREKIA